MIGAENSRIMRARQVVAALAVLFAVAFIVCIVLQIVGLRLTHTLVPEHMGPLRGQSYAYVIPRPHGFPVLRTVGDTFDARHSRLILTEDGRPLPSPHASATVIDQVGKGRYVHLRDNELYFSTTDNTDPRTNGRVYELTVPVTPMRGLTSTVLALALAFAAAAVCLARGKSLGAGSGQLWPWLIASAVFAAFWQISILTDAPRIVQSGDGGVVAGIAAAGLYPDRLGSDLVYGERSHYAFYWTATIPLTQAFAQITGDVGTAYALLMGPMLFLQMVGFLILGRRLFRSSGLAAALAVMTVAPIYVISGELWGSLAEPITRYAYNALFPYLLLLALPPHRRLTPYLVMALCGAGVYLHPVSALSVAMALWFALAFFKEPAERWSWHGLHMVLAGLLFLAVAAPFIISFASAFPNDAANPASRTARELLRGSVGEQYHNVLIALARFVRYTVQTQAGTFGWLWLAGLGSFAVLAVVRRRAGVLLSLDLSFLGLLAVGLLLASAGVTAADQLLSLARGASPLQIDLIRNLRFLVPVALLVLLAGLAWLSRPEAGPRAPYWLAATWGFVVLWLATHQSLPIERLFSAVEMRRPAAADDTYGRDVLRLLKATGPPGSVLVLPATRPTDASELMSLAVRYGAQRPSFFQVKDLNLLSYSGASAIVEWSERRRLVAALEAASTIESFDAGLQGLLRREHVAFLLLHADGPITALLTAGRWRQPIYQAEPWVLYRLD